MKYLIPICLLFALNTLKSQSLWVKGYVGITNEPELTLIKSLDPRFIYVQNRSNSRFFAMPSIVFELNEKSFLELGFTWSNRSNNQIFSILNVPPNDSVAGVALGDTKSSLFGMQFDYNQRFSKNEQKRWQTFVGLSLNIHKSKFDFMSDLPYVISTKADYVGAKIGIVPRAQFQWTKNLLLDISGNLFLFSGEHQKTMGYGTVGTFLGSLVEFNFLSGFYLRVGLAWRIGEKAASAVTTK